MGLEDWLQQAVATVLQKTLGFFVQGINSESLHLDALGGVINLSGLSLRLEAFEALDLPLAVAGGSLGAVRVKVPWRNLGNEAMLISVQSLLLVLTPKTEQGGHANADDEIASAAGGAELLSQQQQVRHRVLDEVLVPTAANVYLDGEAEALERAAALRGERVEPVRHHLELQLVEAVDEGEEVKISELRVALQDRAQRRACRFLEMVEKEH